jgi:hypothetical protein
LVVNPSVPAKTVSIAHAKAHPGKVNVASSGNGSAVVSRSGNPLPDLLGGQLQEMFNPMPRLTR